VAFGESRMVYELNDGTRHDHLVCTVCGRIYEFFDAEIEARQQSVANSLDFTVTGRQLVLFGICAGCRKSGAQTRAMMR
jgi:Fur family ferric uptake transcriptional regulator